MVKTLQAIFDGQVLRPEEPVDLKPNTRYRITVECEQPADEPKTENGYPLTEIRKLATDMGVTDLSTRHSWYAHGRLEDDGCGD